MAADLVRLSMLAVQDWLDAKVMHSRLVMQVHDELVLEVPQGKLAAVHGHLPELMCNVVALRVPLVAEVGMSTNWEEAH